MAVMDEFKEERERMKTQPFKKRLAHFWEYEKIPVIATACVLFMVCSLIYTWVTNKDTALMAAFIDCYADEEKKDAYKAELSELLGIDTDKEQVLLDTSYMISSAEDLSANSTEILGVRVAAHEIDVFLTEETMFGMYADDAIFKDLREILSEEQLAYYADSFFYVDQTMIDAVYSGEDYAEDAFAANIDHSNPDSFENPIPVGVYVNTTEEFDDIFHFISGDKIVFGICFYSEHDAHALKFLDDMTGRVQ